MKNNQNFQQETIDNIYEYAADLLLNVKMSKPEVVQILIRKGISKESAKNIVHNIALQYRGTDEDSANKNILFGALWCIGGIVATVADLGYIFWGAIVFGAIQFFRGIADS